MPKAVDFSVEARDFVALLGKSSTFDKELKKGLRKQLRKAAQTGADAAKAEVLKPPLRSGSHPRSRGLRSGIARGIKVQVASGDNSARVGVFIRSTGSGLDGSRKKLVRRWDKGTFRHQVFGNKKVWVSQSGRPYFGSVIEKQKPQIEVAVNAALDEAKKFI